MEALQVRKLRHPNIVAALKHATVINQDGDRQASSWSNSSGERTRPRSGARDSTAVGPAGTTSSPGSGSSPVTGSNSQSETASSGGRSTAASWSEDDSSDADDAAPKCSVEMETWLVMEYCNRGTLRSGIERGYFSSPTQQPQSRSRAEAPQHNVANLGVVLAVAAEIASAMAYLHSRNVVHGDLCGSNVMLTTDKGKPAGFTAKIADFGLSRQLKAQTISTATYGTVTHMPPELMLQQKLTTAADVFSFGVLLWEMANSAQAWEGMTHTQVITKVALEHHRLPWPAHAPPAIKDLSVRCTLRDHEARPTFPAIQEELAVLQAALRSQPTH
jgi:serine/threonine protein kinase